MVPAPPSRESACPGVFRSNLSKAADARIKYWLEQGWSRSATADTTPTLSPTRDGRLKATGELDGVGYAVIFKPLGMEALSVISMQPASRKERRRYEQRQNAKSQ